MEIAALIIGIAVSFLIGSIPNGVIVGKVYGGIDIRKHGSGNIGTTNALRQMGWAPGILVMAMDIAKGVLGTLSMVGLLLYWVKISSGAVFDWGCGLSLLAASCGHMFSPWLGFKGGKGIATSFGGFLVISPWCALASIVAFLAFCLITRYVSVGSLAGAVAYLVTTATVYWSHYPLIIVAVVLTALVFWAHRQNLVRLAHGQENKFSAGSKKTMQQAREEEAAHKTTQEHLNSNTPQDEKDR